jgi:hypothetical protein
MFCPRFRGANRDPEDKMHFLLAHSMNLRKGPTLGFFYARAYRQFRSAEANHNPEVDTLFRIYFHKGVQIFGPK